MTVRIEHDLLGDREIPAEAYWGIHTLRAVENFKISNQKISDVPQFVRSMVMVKKATAQANGELGAVKPEIAAAIEKACDEVLLKGRCLDQFPSDVYQGGAGTSVNMNTNEVIANLALEILGYEKGRYDIVNPMDHVNASQSTNDAYPTGFRLAVYYSVGSLLEKLALLKDAFAAKADEFKDVLKMGRTQLQDAVPMTAGQEFQSFQVLLEEEILNLDRTRALLLEVNLGATAIGTGVNTPKGYAALAVKKLSEVSGLDCKLTENLIEATSDCGAYVMVHGALKRTAVKLSKICNDLRLLSSGPRAGLKEINLPEMQAGSSIMPAKVNPVIPEVVNQVLLQSHRQRHHHHLRRRSGAVAIKRDGAGHRAMYVRNHLPLGQRCGKPRRKMRQRHYRQPRNLRTLCVQLHRLGHLPEPVYRTRQRRFGRQNLRPNRQRRARSRTRTRPVERSGTRPHPIARKSDEPAFVR